MSNFDPDAYIAKKQGAKPEFNPDAYLASKGLTETSFADKAIGLGETAATIGSSIIAEPLAGLSGMVQAVNPFADRGAGERAVEGVRNALTYDPITKEGQGNIQAIGGVLQPVAELMQGAETGIGDAVFKATGSPTLAAASTTIPTLATEILGIGLGKGAVKGLARVKEMRNEGMIAREMGDVAPTSQQLREVSGGIFDEIDSTGAVLKQDAYNGLLRKLDEIAIDKFNIDPVIDSKATAAWKRAHDLSEGDVPLRKIERLRDLASRGVKDINEDSAINMAFIDEIDDFLNNVTPEKFSMGEDIAGVVGQKYQLARDLWGRARRSEMLDTAMEKAKNQASGFENGIRVQFRQILDNKNKSKYFKPHEREAMWEVVRGTKGSNIAKTIGRLGWSEGQATNMLNSTAGAAVAGSAGTALGGATTGGIGFVAIPIIGQVSKQLAQKLTRNNAWYADQVIRAGSNGDKIVAAYMRNTPKAERSAEELSELLMNGKIDLTGLKGDDLVKEAALLARQRKAMAAGALAVGADTQQGE